MASSLFPARNNPLSQIGQLSQTINAIRTGNADQIAQQMMNTNPMFAEFVKANRGKTAQQILRDAGIKADDFNSIVSMLK